MKAGIAASFWAVKLLKESGVELAGDVLFETVVDEEFAGGNGTLAARLRGHNADFAVLTEPTRMEVCPACLGAFLGDLTIKGRAGMPFTGNAIPNPIFAAARAIEYFKQWQKEWREGNGHPLFHGDDKQLNVVLSSISSTIPGEFTQMGIPLVTAISWIIWCFPGMTEEEFYRRFTAFWDSRRATDPELAELDLKILPTYHFVRPWETPTSHPG